jgi:hypothetical protein
MQEDGSMRAVLLPYHHGERLTRFLETGIVKWVFYYPTMHRQKVPGKPGDDDR